MSKAVERLIDVMRRLRDPQGGCPWDLEQNFKSIAPHTLEETYEVVEAIENGDPQAMKDELGDLLFQIVFHAQMGREAGLFDLDAIATHVADKMIERHPHVFGDRDAKTANAVVANWESDKARKREAQAKAENRPLSALDGVSTALPASLRALKLQNRAARTGFDWTDAKDILAKIREEIGELEAEMDKAKEPQARKAHSNPLPLAGRVRVGGAQQDAKVNSISERLDQASSPLPYPLPQGEGNNKDAIEDELGDLFFALVNLARRLEVDPEGALRRTNRKFERRFREIERRLAAQNRKPEDAPLDELETIWTAIKREEKKQKKAG